MNVFDKPLLETDISLGRLLEIADSNHDLPLVFAYEGRPIGYHVTEVKAARFAALDCGANHEAWSEIFVQLWDVDESNRTHMPAGKFATIIRKVSEHVQLDGAAKLTFEVSDGVRPIQLYCASMPILRSGALHVDLEPRAASCKPRDRWLENETRKSSTCCSPSTANSACCG